MNITFANLDASVTVEQIEGNRDYLHLNPSDMIELNVVGQPSENVTVTGSGTWVAKILKSDLFSFASGTAQYRIEGTPGEDFNIYAIEIIQPVTPSIGLSVFISKISRRSARIS
ncbi:MAG: hypothetical protein LUH15_00575 [Tannerellaceae bacterium]|nr:hypothetical protein [Tannerellaceae bacterium]